ncbi:hypothetical protein G7Y89_g12215 [Cudoniella acicularis]|uniref:Uncharacterized protein n=1 Tax=Cudoniella acicularis TaxID=354080 RepID=A0A8H4VXK0_9HELO|nr:hypothetical protein G7Y89_g12215 [Cudoniella acicularis]
MWRSRKIDFAESGGLLTRKSMLGRSVDSIKQQMSRSLGEFKSDKHNTKRHRTLRYDKMAQLRVDGLSHPWLKGYAGSAVWPTQQQLKIYEKSQCSRIWDPIDARFEPCVLPIISAIPAAISICIILVFALGFIPTDPRGSLLPKWLSSFNQEILSQKDDLPMKPKRQFSRLSGMLLVVSITGLLLQTITILVPQYRVEMIYPAASWAFASVLTTILRPTSTPKSLLVLYISIFTSQVILLLNGFPVITSNDIPSILVIVASVVALGVISQMPLRDPNLPDNEISPAFGPPTSDLRSPEDNLTLWQFMIISWMKPLITLDFSAPVLLQKILQSMEDHRTSRRATLTYALLSLVVRLIASQSAVFSLWYGRRAYERSRGQLITMLYEKTLSRKMISVSSKSRTPEISNTANGTVEMKAPSRWMKIFKYLKKPFVSKKSVPEVEDEPGKSPELASMGKVMNLMRFDAYEVAQRFWEFSNLVSQPLGLILAVILIWRLIGWPCLIGVITVFLAQMINALIARTLLRWEKERRVATDVKLHKISQLVEAIRHLRYYGWQDVWLARIMDARQRELTLRVITALWRILITFTNTFASGMFPVVAFYAYTALAGLPLRVDIAFPALQLFSMLETNLRELPNLITVLLNAKVSIDRIDEFMSEPDKAEAETAQGSGTKLKMKNASFAWPGAIEPVLHDITLSFQPGLTVIYGEVGVGKTALLQALLGELDRLSGDYDRANDIVGYCAQTPWLQSMSIRENILFSSPYDEARYREVMDACALIPDMASFKHGDLSMVGENGVGLSGGQKARLSLARAVYSRAKILLLDDPLSALDHQTAESIVRKCMSGPLLKDRTAILVTHRTELVLHLADQVVQISNGRAHVLDADSILSEELHRVQSSDSAHEESHGVDEELAAIPEKFIEDEYRAHGGVKASIYWEYIKAGKLKWWFVLICIMALYRVIDVGETWFLKSWGEAYGGPEERSTSGLFDSLPSPETDIKPWLIGFFLLALAQAVAFLIAQSIMLVIIYKAGKNLFERVMSRVSHATFRFYDVTPVGRLMNRLTSDINTVDGNISNQFMSVAGLSIAWISSVIVIGSVTPIFLIFAIGLTLAFVVIFLHFLPTSQSLRRLEMVSLSPLISNFGELATGLTSIRAFKVSHLFQARVISVTDNFQKMDHFYWSLQAWLMYRFDNLSAISTFLLTTLALFTGVSPGLTAFVLTAAARFVQSTHLLCRQYGQLQMDFVSVERVVELLHLEQEPPGKVQPPAYWPSLVGDIVFENVTIKYAPHLDPALSDISLTIKGGSTTALIGRTGSGKSTLALSLLATTLPATGRILIDNIDISTVDTQALRKRVTFLAQEPVLFPGTMRANLDPLDEYTDEECIDVLSKIAPKHQWTLTTHIDTGGRNISQGQRQLVGLARALLRRSPIIIMDEATASIDMETAMRIQEILREEMRESTVITIAHRVEAVRNADGCVVLGKGRILEQGETRISAIAMAFQNNDTESEEKGKSQSSVFQTPSALESALNQNDESANIVTWDKDQDEMNPMNWESGKKWRILAVISLMTFITPLSSSIFAPAVTKVMLEFHSTSSILSEIVISIYVLGFAIGPLIIAPLSEIYGRKPLYLVSCFLFLVFTIACGVSSNLNMLIVFRFFAGCAGSTAPTLGGATIGDMFPREKRGAAMALWGMGPQLGPAVGPIIGGFLAEAKGWRWVFWLQVIVASVLLILGCLMLRETYAPVLLDRKTRQLKSETGNEELRSSLHDPSSTKQMFSRAIFRPLKMLLFSPIVSLLSIYTAILFGYLYIFITTFPFVFQTQYHFSIGASGLTYLGLGVGSFLGLIITGKTSDMLFKRQTERNGGVPKPEFRLYPLMGTSPLVACAFLGYGWATQEKISTNMYLVDTFGRYSASAIAASKVLQSVAGAFLPLVGKPLVFAGSLVVSEVKCDQTKPKCLQCSKGNRICQYISDGNASNIQFVADPLSQAANEAGNPSSSETWQNVIDQQVDFVKKSELGINAAKATPFWTLAEGRADSFGEADSQTAQTTRKHQQRHEPQYPYIPLSSLGDRFTSLLFSKLPAQEECHHFFENYCRTIHPLLPVCHLPSLVQTHGDFWDNLSLDTSAELVLLVLSVLYTGATNSNTPQDLEGSLVLRELYDEATRILDFSSYYVTSSPSSMQLLQSILIMNTFKASQIAPFTAFGFLPSAIRFAQSLRLHVGQEVGDPTERETRRQIWWHLIFLDVESTIANGLQVIIRPDAHTIESPSSFYSLAISGDQGISPYSAFSPVMRAMCGHWELARCMQKWFERMPQQDEIVHFSKFIRQLIIGTSENEEGRWARIYLEMQIDRAYCMVGLRFWQLDQFTGTTCHSEVIRTSRSFLRRFLDLSMLSSSIGYSWFVPFLVQPIHALTILLMHLSKCSHPDDEAVLSRDLVDRVFAMRTSRILSGTVVPHGIRSMRFTSLQQSYPRYSALPNLRTRVWNRFGWPIAHYPLVKSVAESGTEMNSIEATCLQGIPDISPEFNIGAECQSLFPMDNFTGVAPVDTMEWDEWESLTSGFLAA